MRVRIERQGAAEPATAAIPTAAATDTSSAIERDTVTTNATYNTSFHFMNWVVFGRVLLGVCRFASPWKPGLPTRNNASGERWKRTNPSLSAAIVRTRRITVFGQASTGSRASKASDLKNLI